MVFIHFTTEDNDVLIDGIKSLESSKARQTQCWKQLSLVKDKILYCFPLCQKRRYFINCLKDVHEPWSCIELRGVQPLSDDDLCSVKYSSKLHVSSYQYRIETM